MPPSQGGKHTFSDSQKIKNINLTHVAREQLKDLLTEHSEERALIEKTQIALFSEQPSEFIASARKLTQILSEHALKEEQMLFPIAEKVLTKKKRMN
jgi:hemerythrin-like domain-containing protein